jgi:lysophospholipase L1-like esterase
MRRIQLVTFLVVAAMLLGAVPARAAQHEGEDFLALGDSVAFGYDPLARDFSNPESFIGYPEALAKLLEVDVANASCPGEASGGFISLASPLDNGCRDFRFGTSRTPPLPLHEKYKTAQLDFAVKYLRHHRDTRLVTIDLGGNDLFVLQRTCQNNPNPTACFFSGFPQMLQTLGANLGEIYRRIRVDAGYRGQIIALTYYALDYTDTQGVQVIAAIDSVVEAVTIAAGGQVASGFAAFLAASAAAGAPLKPCAAGLLIRLPAPTLTCDIHPSPAGRDVLARAIKPLVAITAKED